jgi:hypothetical protein
MSLFQGIGLCTLSLLALASLRSYRAGRMRIPGLLLWWTISILGSLALMFPNRTTVIAQFIGVERGTDLLLYSAILAGIVLAFLGYLRFRILDRQITQMVRHHALANPHEPHREGGTNLPPETTPDGRP